MGIADRGIRILIAIAIVALYFSDVITGTLGIVLMIVAIIFFFQSLIISEICGETG